MAKAPAIRQVAIAGGESLLGAELRDLLRHWLPGARATLVGSEEPGSVILTERGGEPIVITGLDSEHLAETDLLFLAGSQEMSRRTVALLSKTKNKPPVIDLTSAFEDSPNARLRAPIAEPPNLTLPASKLSVIAHPAAAVLAALLRRLHAAFPITSSNAHIFEPASERGRPGVHELHQQTVSLLSFQKPVKQVYDAQLSFNLLARYGADAPLKLEAIEQRIEKHLATLLAPAGPVPMPSIRLIQASVMHGHAFSVWVEFESTQSARDLAAALPTPEFDVRSPDLDWPDPVGIAGQSGVSLGAIEPDRNNRRAAWFWLTADNFRVTAENAYRVAQAFTQK
jgi:aspartate-semialdehyde dehydrogenase